MDGANVKILIEKMKQAVLEGEEEEAALLAQQAIDEKIDLVLAMDEGFLQGIRDAGELYARGDYYLPELVCAADAMKSALAIMDPELKKNPGGSRSKGKVIIATVQGDIHDIGKTIVAAMLTASGYEVHDLGSDVPNETMLQKVRDLKPEVLGMSALLTSTMEEQRKMIELLETENLRSDIRVIVGGAPASHDWAKRIRADGYSDNAINAVRLVDELLAK